MMFLFLALLYLLAVITLFVRNAMVFNYRMRMINAIHRLNASDIGNKIYDWEWRSEKFQRVSYNRMVLLFWIPCSRFVTEEDFTSAYRDKRIGASAALTVEQMP